MPPCGVLEQQPAVRLLFTDVGLPGGLNGRQLADKARQLRPDLVVLFTSGYARNAIVHHGRLDPGVEMIGKPFTYAALGTKIRKVLDEHPNRRDDHPSRFITVPDGISTVRVVDYLLTNLLRGYNKYLRSS